MARLIDKIAGHRATLDPLMAAIAKGQCAPTLLFAGPSGVGKKKSAFAVAQALVCEKQAVGGCGICGPCLRVEKGQSEGLITVEPDGAQIKIEQVREILQALSLRTLGRARVIVIDQAHLLGPQAGNALLKSLEEPPIGTYFILVTHQPMACLPTIRSRAQLIRFSSLTKKEMRQVLGDSVDEWIIESAYGSLESAENLGQSQEKFLEVEEAVLAFVRTGLDRFPGEEISAIRDLLKDRSQLNFIVALLQSLMRDGLRAQAGLEPANPRHAKLADRLASLSDEALLNLSEQTLLVEQDLARNVERGLIFENLAFQLRPSPEARA